MKSVCPLAAYAFVLVACSAGAAVPKAHLPLTIYSGGQVSQIYIPSGYMGMASAIKMDPQSKDHPHAGGVCLKVTYGSPMNWGGVVWQSPPNDWGTKPGGLDITGAKKLTFWARGASGGEAVAFKYGLIGPGKPFSDTATGSIATTLTPAWKQYTINLSGKNLKDIKTAFSWIVAGHGKPITFYLDGIEFK